MSAPPKLRVSLVGQFSSGKSTLLNALLGRAVSPMGVQPVTAFESRFGWADTESATVILENGAQADVGLDQLQSLTDDTARAATVRHVRVGLPAEVLRVVDLRDTPGYDSIQLRHEVVSRRALAESDVAIWVTTIDQAANADEVRKLNRLRVKGVPVLLVVNKVDLYDADEVKEVVDEVREEHGAAVDAVIGVSAKNALRAALGGDEALDRSSGLAGLRARLFDLAFARTRAAGVPTGPALGPSQVACPACSAVCGADDRYCDCGRNLADQHRPCPRCTADNLIRRSRCRQCNLEFEAYERVGALVARSEEELAACLLADAEASLQQAVNDPSGLGADSKPWLDEVSHARSDMEERLAAIARATNASALADLLGPMLATVRRLAKNTSAVERRVVAEVVRWVEGRLTSEPGDAQRGLDWLQRAVSLDLMEPLAAIRPKIAEQLRLREERARVERRTHFEHEVGSLPSRTTGPLAAAGLRRALAYLDADDPEAILQLNTAVTTWCQRGGQDFDDWELRVGTLVNALQSVLPAAVRSAVEDVRTNVRRARFHALVTELRERTTSLSPTQFESSVAGVLNQAAQWGISTRAAAEAIASAAEGAEKDAFEDVALAERPGPWEVACARLGRQSGDGFGCFAVTASKLHDARHAAVRRRFETDGKENGWGSALDWLSGAAHLDCTLRASLARRVADHCVDEPFPHSTRLRALALMQDGGASLTVAEHAELTRLSAVRAALKEAAAAQASRDEGEVRAALEKMSRAGLGKGVPAFDWATLALRSQEQARGASIEADSNVQFWSLILAACALPAALGLLLTAYAFYEGAFSVGVVAVLIAATTPLAAGWANGRLQEAKQCREAITFPLRFTLRPTSRHDSGSSMAAEPPQPREVVAVSPSGEMHVDRRQPTAPPPPAPADNSDAHIQIIKIIVALVGGVVGFLGGQNNPDVGPIPLGLALAACGYFLAEYLLFAVIVVVGIVLTVLEGC